MLGPGHGGRAGERLDAPDSHCDAALSDDHEEADLASCRNVRPAAELHAETRYADHTHLIAVFFPEQRHRPCGNGIPPGPDLGRHGDVAADLVVDDSLDPLQ